MPDFPEEYLPTTPTRKCRGCGEADVLLSTALCAGCELLRRLQGDKSPLNRPQPSPIANNNASAHDIAIDIINARRAKGAETYPTPLQANNGRHSAWDKLEESCDAFMYDINRVQDMDNLIAEVCRLDAENGRLKADLQEAKQAYENAKNLNDSLKFGNDRYSEIYQSQERQIAEDNRRRPRNYAFFAFLGALLSWWLWIITHR